ncbi:MAG: hypothetical protein O3C44_10195 [Proteobacteria bacterium]|nr:hypothetical protein [Pseudomonadota bacterium]MDA0846288.1 hypothetical protein [Pseudomonadota bacterium]
MDTIPYMSRNAPLSRLSHLWVGTAVLAGWLVYGMLGLLAIVGASIPTTSVRADGFGTPDNQWPGIWFICEFAQRQRAPDDACQMFDDEGFQLADGQLSYLRITQSDETACRGDKKGQCFRRDRPEITITKTNRGRLTLRENQFDVTFLGCTQTFYFADTEHYREMWPDDDRCFWASKRRFYIAPFDGIYSFAK